jgi:hypothetical protein
MLHTNIYSPLAPVTSPSMGECECPDMLMHAQVHTHTKGGIKGIECSILCKSRYFYIDGTMSEQSDNFMNSCESQTNDTLVANGLFRSKQKK